MSCDQIRNFLPRGSLRTPHGHSINQTKRPITVFVRKNMENFTEIATELVRIYNLHKGKEFEAHYQGERKMPLKGTMRDVLEIDQGNPFRLNTGRNFKHCPSKIRYKSLERNHWA